MELNKIIQYPQSIKEKEELAQQFIVEYHRINEAKDMANWFEGKVLYYFDKFGLYNSITDKILSKKAFYDYSKIPQSTAEFKISLYKNYIIKYGFKWEDLRGANTKKLHRVIPYLGNKTKIQVQKIIELSKKKRQSLGEFIEIIKGNS